MLGSGITRIAFAPVALPEVAASPGYVVRSKPASAKATLDLQRFLFVNPQVAYVSYHTHDFSWLSFEVDCDLLAEGIFLRPVAAGNRVIDDRDPGGFIAVTLTVKYDLSKEECLLR